MAVAATTRASLSILEAALPGGAPEAIGVLLHDPLEDRLYLRLRRDWNAIADPEDAEVFDALAADLEQKAAEMGGEALLTWLEDTLSNTLRISAREQVIVEDFPRALDRLYRRHVTPKVLPFITHLPRFSARVAAGMFLDHHIAEPAEWCEVPPELRRLNEQMFICEITGRSMEPRIPDGSLCVFRAGVTGSRQGKLLLVERHDLPDLGGRYTVKRYRSDKKVTPEGWRHERIILEPLNPEFEAWELEPDESLFRIVAEFIRVL